jgi:hypothetical protein
MVICATSVVRNYPDSRHDFHNTSARVITASAPFASAGIIYEECTLVGYFGISRIQTERDARGVLDFFCSTDLKPLSNLSHSNSETDVGNPFHRTRHGSKALERAGAPQGAPAA